MASQFEYPADPPELPHVPAKQVVLSAAALWLCYFVLITVRGLVVELGEFNELLWRRALVTLAGILVTLLAWPLLRRFDGRNLGVRVGAALVIMLPAALALAVVNQQAFAPVEQRMYDRAVADSERHEADAAASSAAHDQTAPTVRVRHDVSGNVLIDVMDPPEPPVPQERADPPEPPAPPARSVRSSPRNAQAPPEPPAPPEMPVSVRKNKDGSSEMTAPGGVVIRHNADGTADVVAGGMTVRVEGGEADEIAANIEDARQNIAEAQADARRDAEEARREAEQARIDAMAEGPPVLTPPAQHRATPTAKPAPQRKAQPAPAAKPAPSPTAVPSAVPSPSPTASPTPLSAQTSIKESIEDEGLWRQLTDVALGRYFLLIAWAALYLALGNGEMARAAERREGEYRRAAKAAELRSLRYQVNPHFLFNTLNSLSALVMVGRTEQAEKMIQTISSFYRHSLAGDPTTDVPLSDEIALQRHYLEIEAVRFPERLRIEFEVPKDLEAACVPGMILQPLVENSIKYAVSASTRPVTLRIAAREVDGLLVLTVADDGPGLAAESGSTGIGLANVRSRLAARFGDRATVESGPLPAGGYATVLTMPVIHNAC